MILIILQINFCIWDWVIRFFNSLFLYQHFRKKWCNWKSILGTWIWPIFLIQSEAFFPLFFKSYIVTVNINKKMIPWSWSLSQAHSIFQNICDTFIYQHVTAMHQFTQLIAIQFSSDTYRLFCFTVAVNKSRYNYVCMNYFISFICNRSQPSVGTYTCIKMYTDNTYTHNIKQINLLKKNLKTTWKTVTSLFSPSRSLWKLGSRASRVG